MAIDEGANYGWDALSLAKLAGAAGRVVALEPISATAAMLKVSVLAIGSGQVEIVRSAVSDRSGIA